MTALAAAPLMAAAAPLMAGAARGAIAAHRQLCNSDCPSGFYYVEDEGQIQTGGCRVCPDGSSCSATSLAMPLAELPLQRGYWRHSNRTATLYQCTVGHGGKTPCKGGSYAGTDGEGYCEDGYTGPRCEVCEVNKYFSRADGLCLECPSTGTAVYRLILVLLAFAFAVSSVVVTPSQRKPSSRRIDRWWRWAVCEFRSFLFRAKQAGLQAKAKSIISLFQIMATLTAVFEIRLPVIAQFEPMFKATEVFGLELFLPGACYGSHVEWLLYATLWPVVLALALAAAVASASVYWEWQRATRMHRSLTRAVRRVSATVGEAGRVTGGRVRAEAGKGEGAGRTAAAGGRGSGGGLATQGGGGGGAAGGGGGGIAIGGATPDTITCFCAPPAPPVPPAPSPEAEPWPTPDPAPPKPAPASLFRAGSAGTFQSVDDLALLSIVEEQQRTDEPQPLSIRSYAYAAGRGLRMSLAVILPLNFLCLTTASSRIFRTWQCVAFRVDDGSSVDRAYVAESLQLLCDVSVPEYAHAVTISCALLVVWPIGVPLFHLALLGWCRKPIMRRRPTLLSRAISFLWLDYERRVWYWEVVDNMRRLTLTSFILLVGAGQADHGQPRALAAMFVAIGFLMLQNLLNPYERGVDDLANSLIYLMLMVQYISILLIKGCAVSAEFCRDFSPNANAANLATIFMVFFAAVGLVGLFLLGYVTVMSTSGGITLKEASTGLAPPLTLRKHHKWHVFLSHIWSTGQDQVAVIKRQLQLILPGVDVFLDVDDLVNIGALERYVAESAVVLLFLSKGYFKSRNCLRELRAAAALSKPLLLVHEHDPAKGGLSLAESIAECPARYRDYVFGGRATVPWHRVREFQRLSMQLIAEGILAASPHYTLNISGGPEDDASARSPRVRVYFPTADTCRDMELNRTVTLYASPNNPGAAAAAAEIDQAIYDGEHAGNLVLARQLSGLNVRFLVYLNQDTFAGPAGEALADELRGHRAVGGAVLLLHENDPERGGVSFEHFFTSTPPDLVDGGLFTTLALAMYPGRHREVSLVLVAKALGAVRTTGKRRDRRILKHVMRSVYGSVRGGSSRAAPPPTVSAASLDAGLGDPTTSIDV